MTPRRAPKRLRDAHLACSELAGFTHDRTLDDYRTDRGLQLIVERLFEIIGEALNRTAEDEPALEQDIPDLRRIVGMRNQLSHGYWDIQEIVVWDTVTTDIPRLRVQLERILDERGWN